MPDAAPDASEDRPGDPAADGSGTRQRVVRVRGARRARLTPAPGTHPEPDERDRGPAGGAAPASGDAGPNDDRMRREVPPHY